MPIALIANNQFPLDEVAAILRAEGVETAVCDCDAAKPLSRRTPDVDCAVVATRNQELSKLDDLIAGARALLDSPVRLIFCGPTIKASDRELLERWGVSVAVTPRSHLPRDVAERILGELILNGNIAPSSLGKLKGATRVMRELYQQIEIFAPLDDPVLILGETGCGKELVAGEIHNHSLRRQPILPMNCAEFSPELLASELFGHAQGAFTDARQARKGLFAEAGKGTVFLDEIGDMDLQAQAKLLRVIEDRKFRPVGSNTWQPFQARLVLATHRNLEEAVEEGKFRRDLFARIEGFTLKLPPLRERRADIPLLVHHFVEEFNRDYPKKQLRIPDGALDCLFVPEWSENVRQLRAVIRKAAAYADSAGNISVTWLQEAANRRPIHKFQPNSLIFDPALETWRDVQQRAKVAYFRALLQHTGADKDRALKLSGLGRSQFYEILKEIDKPEPNRE